MPLGPVHLIRQEQVGEAASFYCGVPDAIAAIPPAKISLFPADVVCAECLRLYSEAVANESTRLTE